MSNIIVTVGANDGINLEMNNDEILDNLQLNRNARTGLRIGGNATVACEGGVYVNNVTAFGNFLWGINIEGDSSQMGYLVDSSSHNMLWLGA